MADTVQENVLEFEKGSKYITATLSMKKYINRVKKLASKFPDEFVITAENEDGSIVAHIPVRALKINYSKRESKLPFEPDDDTEDDVDEDWVELDV